eukprot:4499574-Karenia_brevis.AAC.1
MEDIEENEVRAEKLSEVSAKNDAQEDFLTTTVDGSGTVKIKKGARDQSMPKSSEELRARLAVMGNMWCFLRCKFQKSWLEEMTPQVWSRYANFLLGPKVYGLRMRTGDRQEEAA